MDKMNVSIVVFSNGDQVICDLKEVFDKEGEDQKGICLLMVDPYKLSLIGNIDDVQVQFSKWCPYSSDKQFKIPYNSVIAIGQPDKNLSLAYTEKVNQVNESITQEN